MKPNREKLINIMKFYNLKTKQVAKLMKKSEQTVRIWRAQSGRDITDKNLKMLTLALNHNALIFHRLVF